MEIFIEQIMANSCDFLSHKAEEFPKIMRH